MNYIQDSMRQSGLAEPREFAGQRPASEFITDSATYSGRARHALLLVLDGLGVGAMADAPAAQVHAHTVNHVIASDERDAFPTLVRLGLFSVADRHPSQCATFAALGYPGADSYLGHNELLGGRLPSTLPDTVWGTHASLVTGLSAAGFRVEPIAGGHALWVNHGILVSDNLENEPGMAINLAGSLDVVEFDDVLRAGEIVRHNVRNPRVIAFASPDMPPEQILTAVTTTRDGLTGISTPEVGFYKPGFVVRHLGIGVDPREEIPYQLVSAGYSVHLIGKMADVAAGDADVPRRATVDTASVLEDVALTWKTEASGLIAATVQETDLAGHAQDRARFFQVLRVVDRWLASFLDQLLPDALVIVTGDHGNDPTCGPHHTREYVPVLVSGIPASNGPFPALGAVADLVRDYFGVMHAEDRQSGP